MRIQVAFIWFIISTFKLQAREDGLYAKLEALPDVLVEEMRDKKSSENTFVLRVKQPLDHKNL